MIISRPVLIIFFFAGVVFFSGCSTSGGRAPIVDRTVNIKNPITSAGKNGTKNKIKKKQGTELKDSKHDWRPATYVVKKGDTLTEIALDHGLSYRELAKWNNIPNPNIISVGMILKLSSDKTKITQIPDNENTRPVKQKSQDFASQRGGRSKYISWIWPTTGQLAYGFGSGENTKGIGILGESRQAVVASAPGIVVYSGSGIRAYGNMIIIKHNSRFLSVYAKNSVIMVKEGQSVAQGQKISEIGELDDRNYQLHFEIRRLGKPVNPVEFLPELSSMSYIDKAAPTFRSSATRILNVLHAAGVLMISKGNGFSIKGLIVAGDKT